MALVLGALCVMLVYLVVNVGFMYLLPLPQIAQSKLIAATAAEHIPLFGGFGAAIIAAVAMVSAFSGLKWLDDDRARIFFRDGRTAGCSFAAWPAFRRVFKVLGRNLACDRPGGHLRSAE